MSLGPGGRQRPLPRRSPASTPTRRGAADGGRRRRCARARPTALRRGGRRSGATAWRCRPSRSPAWPSRCRSPSSACPFLFTADLGPAELDLLADALLAGIERAARSVGVDRARRRPPLGPARRASAASSSAAARAGWARPRPPRCSPSKAARPGRRAVRGHHRPGQAAGRRARPRRPRPTRPSRIDGDWPGELWALMLDTKSTFDDLVATLRRRRPSRPSASSPTASTATSPAPCRAPRSTWRWRSSTSCTTSTDFDLVVVDTPPTRNALDFLDAPRRLTRFLDHRLYRVLMAPDPGRDEGGQRGRPGVPAHGVQGRRRRGDRRRHRLLPGLRGHGGGLPATGPSAVLELLADRRHRVRAGGLAPARHGRGGRVLRRQAGRGRHRRARR